MTSNSDSSNPKKDQKQIQFEVSSKPNSDSPNGCQTTASIEPENYREEEEEEEEEETESTASSSSLDLIIKNPPFSGAIEVPENDDGFKTPTDQMIPEITECPPAPKRQRKRESRKRKASPGARRSLPIDFEEEVESMFPPAIQGDLGREIKRARSEKTE
ncbi:hypothetical protein RHGRI_015240 [Rhododendron griersonianum]|uniref:Cyclin-dependent protein kinase inhibitor SMR3-like n=1 Tax=Rhododendron griersonianum TaxID=479676 RepID=A0AAV6KCQ1_9ERIC|nr:hypothetical protein RHGRI_015240 [Rhododendron griersonianum]